MPRLPLLVGRWLAAGLITCAGPALATEGWEAEGIAQWRVGTSWALTRPVRAADDVVNVTVGLSHVDIQRSRETEDWFRISGWLTLMWADHRLTWTGFSTLDNVRQVRVSVNTSRSWTPSIQVLNALDKRTTLFPPVTECVVSRTGKVVAVIPVQFQVACWFVYEEAAIRYVAFSGCDRAIVCPITFGSMLTSVDLVNFRPMNATHFASSERFTKRGLWKVTVERKETVRDCCAEPFATLEAEVAFSGRSCSTE